MDTINCHAKTYKWKQLDNLIIGNHGNGLLLSNILTTGDEFQQLDVYICIVDSDLYIVHIRYLTAFL